MKKVNKIYRSKEKEALYNIAMFYKTRNNAITFHDDYSSMISEAKDEPTKGKGLNILTP